MPAIKTDPVGQLISYTPAKRVRNFEGIISINMTNEVLGRPYEKHAGPLQFTLHGKGEINRLICDVQEVVIPIRLVFYRQVLYQPAEELACHSD